MYSSLLCTLKSRARTAFSVCIMAGGVGQGSIRKQHFQQKEGLKGFYVKLLVLGGISFSVVFIDSPLMGDGEACWDWKSFSPVWLSPRSLWVEWCFKEGFLACIHIVQCDLSEWQGSVSFSYMSWGLHTWNFSVSCHNRLEMWQRSEMFFREHLWKMSCSDSFHSRQNLLAASRDLLSSFSTCCCRGMYLFHLVNDLKC